VKLSILKMLFLWLLSVCLMTLVSTQKAVAEPVLESQSGLGNPSVHANGIQFDLTNAFVGDLSLDGSRIFFTTHNGGRTWNNLIIREDNRILGQAEDLRIIYYNEGSGVLYYNGNSYYSESEATFRKLSINSIVLRGQDGFRVDNDLSHTNRYRLLRTMDGGRNWFDTRSVSVPFTGVEVFDLVTTNLLIACVYIEDADRPFKHQLMRSFDFGRTWASISDPEADVGIWATHVFFLSETTGWISSDRDDGMFLTLNAGKTWKEVQIPERVTRAIFFKDTRHGRIIGGVDDNVYETEDGGQNWRKLAKVEIISPSFLEYFAPCSLSRWNDFEVLRSILSRQQEK
jgi:photosystem II stability/assembly factor-like uncharacterized protein